MNYCSSFFIVNSDRFADQLLFNKMVLFPGLSFIYIHIDSIQQKDTEQLNNLYQHTELCLQHKNVPLKLMRLVLKA